GDYFGSSVAVGWNNVVVGAYGDDDNGSSSGSAYVFDVTTGEQLYKLLPGDGAAGDYFGSSVAVGWNNVVVGAYGDDDNGSSSGSAYVFNASLLPLWVDDDATNDPVPGDPSTSDPLEDGSIEHPYDSIQEAIDSSRFNVPVFVLDGTYSGFGNGDIRLNGKEITVRSLNGKETTKIEGNFYNGFICDTGETTNSIIQGFTIHTWKDFFGKAGVLCNESSPSIIDCHLWDCGEAGILCMNNAAPYIKSCKITENQGGIRSYNSSPLIESCMIVSNVSETGAGLLFGGSSAARVINCLVAGNCASNEGGGVFSDANAVPAMINCTVFGNSAVSRGGGISTIGTPVLRNCIIYNNSAPDSANIYYTAALDIQYTCMNAFYPGIGNVASDPCFIDPAARNFRLATNSPCINSGMNVAVPGSDDLDGGARIQSGTVDMGAYEYSGSDYLVDSDGDGLTNVEEARLGTDPNKSDSDGDGFSDSWELSNRLNPLLDDTGILTYIGTNSPDFGFYTEESIGDLAMGEVLIGVSNSTVTLKLQLLQSDDLVTWTNATTPVEWSMPAEEKAFFRLRAEP
nr:right-handed parallel beta-helix repeat-containing protein [Kiritimatiellia bacterium]